MKKSLLILFTSFFITFYISLAILSSYLSHVYYTSLVAHSILLIIICSTAFSTCYFYYYNYSQNRIFPFFVMALFFEVLGFMFFFHAVSIPSFYFFNEYIFDVTEHFGPFLGGLVLMLMFLPDGFAKNFFYKNRKKILVLSALALILWFIFYVFSIEASKSIFDNINSYIFLSSIFLLIGLVAIFKERGRLSEYKSFNYLIAGLGMFLNAAIEPLFYKEWNVLWWYFHLILVFAGFVIFAGILKKCDKISGYKKE